MDGWERNESTDGWVKETRNYGRLGVRNESTDCLSVRNKEIKDGWVKETKVRTVGCKKQEITDGWV
jgi:hypothetical protein